MPCHWLYSTSYSPPSNSSTRLERVILRRNLLDKVVSENRHFLYNVLAHARYLGEEEEGEEAGYAAEAAGENTTIVELGFVAVEGEGGWGRTLWWVLGRWCRGSSLRWCTWEVSVSFAGQTSQLIVYGWDARFLLHLCVVRPDVFCAASLAAVHPLLPSAPSKLSNPHSPPLTPNIRSPKYILRTKRTPIRLIRAPHALSSY